MTYLIKRGRRARLRLARAHLASYDQRGNMTGLAFCGRSGFDMSINVPLGLHTCKDCARKWNQ